MSFAPVKTLKNHLLFLFPFSASPLHFRFSSCRENPQNHRRSAERDHDEGETVECPQDGREREDSHGEFEPPSRKRLRRRSNYDDDWEEDCNDGLESIPKAGSRKKASYGHKDNLNGKSGSRHMIVTAGPRMQEAFQPGATPAQPGKRHFLCYNMLGSITTMEHDGYSHIE
ncbi:UNVERIFIED_CONTAM: hypothetical protein Sindi_2867700, partial [Sesamum indicum]